MLTNADIEKFKQIYKDSFGEELNNETALEMGLSLVNLMKLIYKPMTEKQYQNLQIRRKELGII